MPIVVRGIVHRLDAGKAHTADDEDAEQRGHEDRHDARSGQRGGVDAVASGLVENVFILVPHAPSTRGRGSRLSRRQVSWLAGRRLPSAFPEASLQWPYGGVLAAYSCGGSRGIGENPSPRSLLRPTECGNRRRGDYSGLGPRRKRAIGPALTKRRHGLFSGPIDGLSRTRANRERGTDFGPIPRLPPQL